MSATNLIFKAPSLADIVEVVLRPFYLAPTQTSNPLAVNGPPQRQPTPDPSLDNYKTGVERTSKTTDTNTLVDEKKLLQAAMQRFSERLDEDIESDLLDARNAEEDVPNQTEIDAGRKLGRTLAAALALAQKLRYAGFIEESGRINIAIQSMTTGRRADFRLAASADTVLVNRLERSASITSFTVSASSGDVLQEHAKWVLAAG